MEAAAAGGWVIRNLRSSRESHISSTAGRRSSSDGGFSPGRRTNTSTDTTPHHRSSLLGRPLLLSECNLAEESFEIVASALQSATSPLRKLDLSKNKLGESGGKLLSAALLSPNCKLQTLDVSFCQMGNSGVELLCAGLSKVSTLRMDQCCFSDNSCDLVASVLHQSANSQLRELDFSNNKLGESAVKLLCAGLRSPVCDIQALRLCGCKLNEKSCESVISALQSVISSLRELDLRNNNLGDSGVEQLCALLMSPNCKIQTLR
ncbi:NACHT, LRR and PYD domains-containing protein 12-like [Megalops cyprinoides]|uniref:NACHT, LRR and PYD domains-containing protein 12-like n=1 Tax=Megalops cyprinoides TaxID=118141 RepID=UPI0018649015|nr:NACHT, LRR and PYD domains-containing protein 12-like [Megalops cyprinoides]